MIRILNLWMIRILTCNLGTMRVFDLGMMRTFNFGMIWIQFGVWSLISAWCGFLNWGRFCFSSFFYWRNVFLNGIKPVPKNLYYANWCTLMNINHLKTGSGNVLPIGSWSEKLEFLFYIFSMFSRGVAGQCDTIPGGQTCPASGSQGNQLKHFHSYALAFWWFFSETCCTVSILPLYIKINEARNLCITAICKKKQIVIYLHLHPKISFKNPLHCYKKLEWFLKYIR